MPCPIFMKTKFHLLFLLTVLSASNSAQAQSTAFTYNGRMSDKGAPPTGVYEMRFALYDVNIGGNLVVVPAGSFNTLTVNPVGVTNGLFTVRLDFGVDVFTGPPRWLEVAVRPGGGGSLMILAPRQEVTSSPYAIRAQTAGTAASVANGTVTAAQLNTAVAPAAGQFLSYNNGSFVWADPAAQVGEIWSRNGTVAYYTGGGVGIGTNNTTTGVRFEVNGSSRFVGGGNGGALNIGAPNGESGLGVSGVNRFDLRFNGSTLKLVAGPGVGPPPAENGITIHTNGAVGIGGANPFAGYRFFAAGQTVMSPGGSGGGNIAFGTPNGETGITINTNTGNRADVRFDGSTLKMVVGPPGGPPSLANGITINAAGKVGIGGSLFPIAKVEIVSQDALRLIGYQPFLTLLDDNAGYAATRIQTVGGELNLFPESYLNGNDLNAYAKLFNSGNFSVKSLTIRGGADLAEPFAVREERLEKGSVVVIDKEQAGRLRLSTQAYDKRVAGIVSGANGINPGISLHQEGAIEGGENVALTGRVYVRADATNGAIEPGDLLTTSETPGHAMKVTDHTKAQGAILGKAMSNLAGGKGMVLVLVTLQ